MKTRKALSLFAAAAMAFSLAACGALQADARGSSGSTDEADVTAAFVFSDSGITVSGGNSGYDIDGTALTIESAGTYTVSGSCADGSIKIKKGTVGVTLVLEGLTLTSADTAPITCGKSTAVTILAAGGTKNTLTDSERNNDASYPDNSSAENAVIKCKDGSSVTIGGSGTLNLTANGKNGIKSGQTTDEDGEASLTIRDVTLDISAPVNDAINAEQLLTIESGVLTIAAGDDAIHCDLVMTIGGAGTDGPDITITESYEGIEAAELNICSGNISIISSDDCLNAANSDLSGYAFTMNISGGVINAYTSGGDGFDSNGDLTISGGTVTVWTANTADNQPLDADGTITISGGTVLAAGDSGGMGISLEATQPCLFFGSSGSMGGQPGGFPGQGGSSQTGDSDSSAAPETGTAPADMSVSSSVSIAAGDAVTIHDADGNTVYSGEALCDARYVIFSSADLTADSTYTLCVNGESSGEAAAQNGTVSTGMDGTGGQPSGTPGEPPEGFDGQLPDFPSGDRPEPPDGQPGERPSGAPDGMAPDSSEQQSPTDSGSDSTDDGANG